MSRGLWISSPYLVRQKKSEYYFRLMNEEIASVRVVMSTREQSIVQCIQVLRWGDGCQS